MELPELPNGWIIAPDGAVLHNPKIKYVYMIGLPAKEWETLDYHGTIEIPFPHHIIAIESPKLEEEW